MTDGDESLWAFDEDEVPSDGGAEKSEPPPAAVPEPAAAPAAVSEPAAAASSEPAGGEPATEAEGEPEGEGEADVLDPFAEEEEGVGTTAPGRAASDALVALGRAARSYLLYEPDNEAIRNFLDNLRAKMSAYLDVHGAMPLTVRPWEMVLGHEVVYLNRDRERSLSFKLFRDGVRRVTIQPDVPWEELTQLLGILSIRFVGVRQQEDDIVTLLWKAGFKRIEVDSVEGFVPEDDETEVVDEALLAELGEDVQGSAAGMYGAAPQGFDVPWPEYRKRVPVGYKPVSEEALQELAHEDASMALPGQCVRLLREILEVAANPVEPLELDEAIPILREIRDFLLSEGLLSSLLEVLQAIKDLPFREKDKGRQVELLAAFTDERALSRIIRSVPSGVREVPDELLRLVDMMPGDPVPLLLRILRQERANTARFITRALIVRAAEHQLDGLVAGLPEAEPAVAADLLNVVASIDLVRGVEVSLEMVLDADVAVQLVAMGVIEQAEYTQEIGQRLARMMDVGNLEVRLRALKILETQRERWAFHAVASRLKRYASRDLDDREIDAFAKAMVIIWEERAQHTFLQWVRPRKLLGRVLPGQYTLKRAAVTGLSFIPGLQAEECIRVVAKGANAELHRHCMQALVRHRRLETRTEDAS